MKPEKLNERKIVNNEYEMPAASNTAGTLYNKSDIIPPSCRKP
jgi:hypothetical protein